MEEGGSPPGKHSNPGPLCPATRLREAKSRPGGTAVVAAGGVGLPASDGTKLGRAAQAGGGAADGRSPLGRSPLGRSPPGNHRVLWGPVCSPWATRGTSEQEVCIRAARSRRGGSTRAQTPERKVVRGSPPSSAAAMGPLAPAPRGSPSRHVSTARDVAAPGAPVFQPRLQKSEDESKVTLGKRRFGPGRREDPGAGAPPARRSAEGPPSWGAPGPLAL